MARPSPSIVTMPGSATPRSRALFSYQGPLRRIWRHATLLLGVLLVALLMLLAALAPLVSPNSPTKVGVGPSMAPPSVELPLGTDKLGRDMLARISYGARTTLIVSISSVALALLLGVTLGLIAGYIGGWVDQFIMRVMDIFLAFPGLLLAIAVVAVLGPSIPNLVLTIGLLYAPSMARITRAPVLSIKNQEFVQAARACGLRETRIALRHVLPNILTPVIVEASLAASRAIITESALAYLGLGAPPPTPSWGEMLSSSRQFMTSAPWAAMFPGLAIVYASIAFILLGNGLQERLDPHRRRF